MSEQHEWSEHVRSDSRRLHGIAHRILGDPEAAADACQQALARAWERRAQLRDRSALGAWLCTAVANEALGMLRRRRVEQRAVGELAEPETGERDATADLARQQALMLAMDELPEKTRAVVVMRLVVGLSGNEVKERLGLSASEVSRRLHAGMRLLRGHLSECLPNVRRSQP